MIIFQSKIYVERLSARAIFDFLIAPTDQAYRRWWPGAHLVLHTLKQTPNHIGNIVYMDELIGKRRVKVTGVVVVAEPALKIVWQMKQFIRLPVWLSLELQDDPGGVMITHQLKAGFKGSGRIFDFIFRVYFSDNFKRAMDEHVNAEFPKLKRRLHS